MESKLPPSVTSWFCQFTYILWVRCFGRNVWRKFA